MANLFCHKIFDTYVKHCSPVSKKSRQETFSSNLFSHSIYDSYLKYVSEIPPPIDRETTVCKRTLRFKSPAGIHQVHRAEKPAALKSKRLKSTKTNKGSKINKTRKTVKPTKLIKAPKSIKLEKPSNEQN